MPGEGGFLFARLPKLPRSPVSHCWGWCLHWEAQRSGERHPETREGSGAAFACHSWQELTGAARRQWERGVHVRLTLVMVCFPPGTQAFLLRLYNCCATDSLLPRKGKHDRYGVKFPQSHSASSFSTAAWLLRSGSVISLAVDFFRALLAVGCPLPWLQGKPGGTLPVPSSREGASSFHGLLLPVTGGSFAEGSCELLHLESVWACWSGGGEWCAFLLRSPAASVLLPAWDVPLRGTFTLQAALLAWQQNVMPPTTSETSDLLLS